jgi:hypothetical protein
MAGGYGSNKIFGLATKKRLLPQQKNGRSKKGRVYLDNILSRNRWHTFAGILTLVFNQQFRPWI